MINLVSAVDNAVSFSLSEDEISTIEAAYAAYCPICKDCFFASELKQNYKGFSDEPIRCPAGHDAEDSLRETIRTIVSYLIEARNR